MGSPARPGGCPTWRRAEVEERPNGITAVVRRERLITEAGSRIQQIRALLECVWPAALDTARQPLRSKMWAAAMAVILDRDGGDLARTRRLGLARFERAVRREPIRQGGQKPRCGSCAVCSPHSTIRPG